MGPGVSSQPGFFRIGEDQLTPSIYSPVALGFVADYSIKTVSREKTGGGVPRQVLLFQKAGLLVPYRFEDEAVAASPTYADEAAMRSRLQMVDAEGWACTNNPAYYDLYPGDGELYRFVAASNSEDYLQLVLHRTVTGREETLDQIGVELIRDAGGLLRQVLVPTRLCDVVVSNEWEYAIKMYRRTDVGTEKNGEGVYEPNSNAVPVEEWVISNPEPSTLTKLRVAQSVSGKTNIYDYTYEPDSRDWSLTSGGGMRKKTIEKAANDSLTMRTVTDTVRDQNDRVVERIRMKIQAFSLGEGVVETVNDPDKAALTTSCSYDSATRIKTKQEPDGNWVSYTYDSIGRKTIEVTPWKDSIFDSPANSARAIYYDYAPVVAGDAVLSNDQRPRTVTEKVLGITVAKTYHAYVTNSVRELQEIEKKCVVGTAEYGDTNNICTITTYYGTYAANHKIGRLKSIDYPDGRLDSFDYEYGIYHTSTNPAECWFEADLDGEAWRETVTHGTVDHPDGIKDKTTQEVTIKDGYNQEVLSETYVYTGGTNFERIAWVAQEFDDYYHPIHVYRSTGEKMDGTWGGNCCGKEWEKSAEGIETTYGHDLLNRLVLETKKGTNSPADDFKRIFTLDAVDRKLTETISGGTLSLLVSSNVYDRAGRKVESTDSAGLLTTFQYQNGGQISTVIGPGGTTNFTETYLDGRMKSMRGNAQTAQVYDYGVNSDGTRWTKVYSGQAGFSSPAWNKTTVDLFGRSVQEEKPGFGGGVVTNGYTYNNKGQLVSHWTSGVTPQPFATLFEYNELGEQTRSGLDVNGNGVLDPAGPDRVAESDTSFETDLFGNWWKVSMSKVYAADNSSAAVTNRTQKTRMTALGVSSGPGLLINESQVIDIHGNATVSKTCVDRSAKKTTQTIDYPDSAVDDLNVSVNGLMVSNRNKTGLEIGFAYDSLNRKTGEINPRTGTSVTHYNDKGQVDWSENAAGNRTSYAFDPETGRRVSVTDAASNVVYMAYDMRGQAVTIWGATYPVAYTFDEYNRMMSMTTYRGGSGWFGAMWPTDPGTGDVTTWLYDQASGLLTNKVHADGKGPVYTYSIDGKLASRVWARGVTTAYSYTNSGELVKIDYSDSTSDVMFSLNRIGQQMAIVDGQGTRVFTYNDALLLVSETNVQGTIGRTYDGLGRAAGFDLTLAGATEASYSVQYSYSDVGRFLGVSASINGQTNTWAYSYLPDSDLIAGWSNMLGAGLAPLAVSRSYESQRDLLTQVKNTSGTHLVSEFDYQNDAVGRRTRRIDTDANVVTNDFEYNTRSELINASMGANRYGYVFDPIGNRTVATNNSEVLAYAANELNQYTNISDGVTITPVYDLDGNLLTNGIWSFAWDGENRLVGVSSNGAAIAVYKYDYMGRRYVKTANGMTNSFIYDGWAMIRESDGATANTFVYGLDLSGTLQGDGSIGGILSGQLNNPATSKSATEFYMYDGNGNVVDLVSEDADAIVAHYEYSPFGEIVEATGPLAFVNPWRFSTKYTDDENGLVYYGLRFYNSQTGRWLSRDPIGEAGGNNPYLMVNNDPVAEADVLGLFSLWLDTPADPKKCQKVRNIISAWAAVNPINNWLWQHYLSGGGDAQLPFSWFDPLGHSIQTTDNMLLAMTQAGLNAAQSLPCDTSKEYSKHLSSHWRINMVNTMIFQWTYTLEWKITILKKCDECKRCLSVGSDAKWKHRADDDIDFDHGAAGWFYPPYYISDRLVTACNLGKDYHIWAELQRSKTLSGPCK